MCYRGIIFDMDGVIVNTNLLHYKAWSVVANKLGLKNYTYEDNEKERGAGRREGIKRLMHLAGKELTEKEIDEMEELKNRVFFEYLDKVKKEEIVFSDVEYTLKELDKKGIKKVLGSSSKNGALLMEKLGLKKYFISIIDGSMVKRAKPDPEIFKKCIDEMKLKTNEVLIVEDSMNGIEAGSKLGIDCCGKNLNSKEVKYTIKNLRDILGIIN